MPTQHVATLLGATCYVRLATLLRHVATCWVLFAQIWPVSNLNQQHPTCCNTVAKRTQHVAPNNVATCCVGMLGSFGRGLRDFANAKYLIASCVVAWITVKMQKRRESKFYFGLTLSPRLCAFYSKQTKEYSTANSTTITAIYTTVVRGWTDSNLPKRLYKIETYCSSRYGNTNQ